MFAANRVPDWYGEVYKLERDGTRVDLSNSPAPDLAPAVSPDGTKVAFVSMRGGTVAIYVADTDGKGLRRLSPPLFSPGGLGGAVDAEIVWSPDSRRILASVSGSYPNDNVVYLGVLAGGWRLVARDADQNQAALAWSPDSRFGSYTTKVGSIQAVSSAGKRLWSVAGLGWSAWSKSDRLAVAANSYTIDVYNSRGRTVSEFGGGEFSWSPGGDALASMTGKHLQVRRGGTGKPVLDARISGVQPGNGSDPRRIGWVDATHLRVFGTNYWIGYDVAHKRAWKLPPLATMYGSLIQPDGAAVGLRYPDPGIVELRESGPGTSPEQVVRTAPSCVDVPAFQALQFVPHQDTLIYQSGCPNPSADIYAINPDGNGLRQLTATATDETEPSLSPDGTSVVYVQKEVAETCKGCPQTLWRVSIGGGTPQQLTQHSFDDKSPFDDGPSWSPDGKTIAFRSSGAAAPILLSEIAATGGAAQNLGVKGIGEPVWGPSLIAFSDFAVAHPVIKTVDPSGGAARTVLNDDSAHAGDKSLGPLAWSADGRLAYVENNPAGKPSIFTVGANTPSLDVASLLPQGSRVSGLAWSPDGTHFAFAATDVNGVGEVYTVATNGSDLTQITDSIGAVGTLSWR